jgi:glycosyltransferase involved in cell wall biosynthesis
MYFIRPLLGSTNGSKKFLMVASLAESLLNFRSELLSDIQAKGYQVHVAAPNFKYKKQLTKELSERDIFVHDIPMWRNGFNPLLDLWTLISLWRLMIAIRPDYFLGYTVKPVVYGLIAARCAFVKNRVGLITGLGYAFATTTENNLVKKLIQNLYKVSLSFSTTIFFQNKDDRKLFKELRLISSIDKAHVVNGSGVNLTKFKFCEVKKGSLIFILIGRLLKAKGILEYMEAASKLKVKSVNTRFLLVGPLDSGPDSICSVDLDEWINAQKLEYLGEVKDVRSIIRDCSVMVLPSYREGVPRSVLEAMAMGKPIITTDAPGCRETVIDGENGFLVPVKNVDALVEAMKKFIDDPSLIARMGTRSRQIAEEKYDVRKVNAVMLKAMGIE